jgi:hypothetical protein
MKALNPTPQPEMRTAIFPLEGGSVSICAPSYMVPADVALLREYIETWLRLEAGRPEPQKRAFETESE